VGVGALSKSRSHQQVAPVSFRKSNCIPKSIEITATQPERGKAKAIHSSGVEILKERQVISTFVEEDLPREFLMRRSEKEGETPFGFRTELGCAHATIIPVDARTLKVLGPVKVQTAGSAATADSFYLRCRHIRTDLERAGRCHTERPLCLKWGEVICPIWI
jgi:hypothetical protein